jgi:hypothetical protein
VSADKFDRSSVAAGAGVGKDSATIASPPGPGQTVIPLPSPMGNRLSIIPGSSFLVTSLQNSRTPIRTAYKGNQGNNHRTEVSRVQSSSRCVIPLPKYRQRSSMPTRVLQSARYRRGPLAVLCLVAAMNRRTSGWCRGHDRCHRHSAAHARGYRCHYRQRTSTQYNRK